MKESKAPSLGRTPAQKFLDASSPRTGIKISGACYRNPVKVVRVLQD